MYIGDKGGTEDDTHTGLQTKIERQAVCEGIILNDDAKYPGQVCKQRSKSCFCINYVITKWYFDLVFPYAQEKIVSIKAPKFLASFLRAGHVFMIKRKQNTTIMMFSFFCFGSHPNT